MKIKRIITVIFVLLLVVIGILSFVNYKTGIFKTNKQKFFKYVSKNKECINILNSEEIQKIRSKKNQNPYTVDSSLVLNSVNDSYTITANTSAQNSSDITTAVDIQYNNENIAKFNLIKKSNLVGLKMDELANGYICAKNNNLTELAKNAGMEDTSEIPENINWISCLDVLNFSQSDVNYLGDRCLQIVSKNIAELSYNKEKTGIKIEGNTCTATGYKMALTENETKQILKELFESLAEDSRALNIISSKMKLLNVPSKYTQIEYLSNLFKKTAEEINNVEANDEQFIEIICYVENDNVVQTSIKLKKHKLIKLTFNTGKQEINIKQDILNEGYESNLYKVDMLRKFHEMIEKIGELDIQNNYIESENTVITKCKIELQNHTNIEYNSKTKIYEQLEKNTDFEDSNKIILNELEESKLTALYNVLDSKIKQIYEEKKSIMGSGLEL